MGVVFKARQVNLNRIVALKMILAGQFAGQEDIQRFYTEAEAAANLDHPGIVPIFEIGEHEGQHYFSMGYIEGESLAQKVADGPLPPEEAAELVKKVCDAMTYAHERGVIHRDLKPANILIDRNGQPKVTDFGLAKKTEADSNLTGTGQILGTPAYMPPEQASGKTDVGPLADVYSLGAILYCLLTGRPPFQAASPMDTLLQVLDKDPVPPTTLNSAVPIDLETICLKCLAKLPTDRYAGAIKASDDLGRFLAGKPILARPASYRRAHHKWLMREPITSGALVACVLAVPGWTVPSVLHRWNSRGAVFWTRRLVVAIRRARCDLWVTYRCLGIDPQPSAKSSRRSGGVGCHCDRTRPLRFFRRHSLVDSRRRGCGGRRWFTLNEHREKQEGYTHRYSRCVIDRSSLLPFVYDWYL